MKRIFTVLFILVCVVFISESVLLGVRIIQGAKLAGKARAFAVRPHQPKVKLLIVGDSTGVGVGARDASSSVAGMISKESPSAEIRNLSRSTARASDILAQVRSAADGEFDIVLIQAGWDDVIRFTELRDMESSFLEILHTALRKAPRVYLMGPWNIGLSPAFFPPVDRIYSARAARVRDLLILLSRETGVEYVDLFRTQQEEPLLENPGRYFAQDRMHPADSGYALWYKEMKDQTSFLDALKVRQ